MGLDVDFNEEFLLALLTMLDDDPILLSSMWLPRGEWMGVKTGDDVGLNFGVEGSFMAKNFSEKTWS